MINFDGSQVREKRENLFMEYVLMGDFGDRENLIVE